MSWFETEQLEVGLWSIVEPHTDSVTSYLLAGQNTALLVDTGLGIGDMRAQVEELTSLPVTVVNTHAHYDHIGGNHQFGAVWAHEAERERIESGVPGAELRMVAEPEAFLADPPPSFDADSFHIPGTPVTRVLADGDRIDLGGRALEVIHSPGHSPGSICLWDRDGGLLIGGDVVYFGNMFASLPGSDFRAYRNSLRRLVALTPRPRLVLPGHGPTPLRGEDLLTVEKFFSLIAEGAVQGRYRQSPWGPVLVYAADRFNVLLEP